MGGQESKPAAAPTTISTAATSSEDSKEVKELKVWNDFLREAREEMVATANLTSDEASLAETMEQYLVKAYKLGQAHAAKGCQSPL